MLLYMYSRLCRFFLRFAEIYTPAAWAAEWRVMKNTYGIQMYSLRDITKDDLRGALKAVADMGYKTVEFAGFFDHPADEVKAWLDEYGLAAVGTHTGWNLLDEKFDETVAYHKVIGCKNIIMPWAPFKTNAELDMMVSKINKWIPLLKAEGIELHYHNHADELRELEPGFVPLFEFAKRTEINFEIDTYWAYVAGRDPVEVLDQLGDRVKMIHLKDGTAEGRGYSLGLGTAPVKAVLAKALETGRDIVVESEGCEPSGIEEVKRCIEYLAASEGN